MTPVSFSTPISHGDHPQRSWFEWAIDTVEDYFYLGGDKAFVQPNGRDVVVTDAYFSYLTTAAKIASYATLVLPAAAFAIKGLYRATHTFTPLDVKKELELSELSDDLKTKIGTALKHAFAGKDLENVEGFMGKIHSCGKGNIVFTLDCAPQFFFKAVRPGSGHTIDPRFNNIVRAKEVVEAHRLSQLVIPKMKLFDVSYETDRGETKTVKVLAEEALEVEGNEFVQKEKYHTGCLSDETARQLAQFISLTGWSDMEWRNALIMEGGKMAMVDLEDMRSVHAGLFGDPGLRRRGLLRCMGSEGQIEIVRRVGASYGYYPMVDTIPNRLEELKRYQKMAEAHGKLLTDADPVKVDPEQLGLDLTATAKTYVNRGTRDKPEWKETEVNMGDVVNTFVTWLNNRIALQAEDPTKTTKETRRQVSLHTVITGEEFSGMSLDSLGATRDTTGRVVGEERNKLWIVQIIQALTEKGILFDYKLGVRSDFGDGYVQA